MAVCGKCVRRLIIWIILTLSSVATGLFLDLKVIGTRYFPLPLRIIGLFGIFVVHFLLKRTGRLLKMFGNCERWGWSTVLITYNVYKCVRHPHHLGVGLFMTFLGLLIGYPITLLIITISQWTWVFLFVIFVEENECVEKFGLEFIKYRENVPMLFCNPICIIKELLHKMK